jgi:hypothetical protein
MAQSHIEHARLQCSHMSCSSHFSLGARKENGEGEQVKSWPKADKNLAEADHACIDAGNVTGKNEASERAYGCVGACTECGWVGGWVVTHKSLNLALGRVDCSRDGSSCSLFNVVVISGIFVDTIVSMAGRLSCGPSNSEQRDKNSTALHHNRLHKANFRNRMNVNNTQTREKRNPSSTPSNLSFEIGNEQSDRSSA